MARTRTILLHVALTICCAATVGFADVPDSTQPRFDIRTDITRGQAFLKEKVVGYRLKTQKKRIVTMDRRGRIRPKIITEKLIEPNFLLAVEDMTERKIRQVRITSDGRITDGFEITTVRENGVGSRFEVTYPENMAILALRTTVRNGREGFKEVVYTPYSPEIDTPEVREAGINYLMQQIELAQEDLDRRRVKLTGFDRLGADIEPQDVALVLSIIEHIDPARFKTCQRGKEVELAHEVLTVIGANTVTAYAYSKSPAGAMGLFQIVPSTYKRLQEKYQGAGLKKDFMKGCTDHVNAAKASLLLFDSDLLDLPEARLSAVRKSLRSAGMYLAAAYNCGSRRVEQSTKECGHEWTCRLPEETKIYLKKFDVVWNMAKTGR
jgi:hypothetical protein